MGCGETIVKYILFLANLFFALAGLALLGVGIAAQLQLPAVSDHVDVNLALASMSSIVIGSIVFLIAFFGCCGAIRENNCMLVTYSIFMLVLLIVKMALAVLVFVNLDTLVSDVPRWLGQVFSGNIEAFHEIETSFQCCGVSGAQSYLPSISLPKSCCTGEVTVCTALNANSGCNSVLQDFLSTFGVLIGSFAIVVAAVELVAVIFGLCLSNHARNKARRSHY